MNTLTQVFTRCCFLAAVFLVVVSVARPFSTDDDVESILRSPLINAHARSYARKRHAEIRLGTEIGRRLAQMKRIEALNKLMEDLDTSHVYTVQDVDEYRRILERLLRKRRGA